MLLYFGFVLGIGAMLRRYVHTSEDFFLSGRSIPAWVTGLAFISANLGAQEVIGMGASGAKSGIATSHFYWIGAIPAMVFVGLFMMPFYYGSRARSVPEYLKLRFDEKTRGLNAISFAVMTVFSSGISLYAMGKLLNLLLGWSFDVSILVAAGIVLAYIFLGGPEAAGRIPGHRPRDAGAGGQAQEWRAPGGACCHGLPTFPNLPNRPNRRRVSGGNRAAEARCADRRAAARRARSRRARLRSRHADDARAFLPGGAARARPYGAARLVHVGDGGECDRLQHGLDVRSVPELRPAGRAGRALPGHGPVGDGVRGRDLGRGGLRGRLVQQHHGFPAARVRVRQRTAVRDVRAGDVLETRHRSRRFHRPRRRHAGGCDPPRALAAGGRRGGREGRLSRGRHDVPQRARANVLDGHRRLGHVLRGDHRDEPRHQTTSA